MGEVLGFQARSGLTNRMSWAYWHTAVPAQRELIRLLLASSTRATLTTWTPILVLTKSDHLSIVQSQKLTNIIILVTSLFLEVRSLRTRLPGCQTDQPDYHSEAPPLSPSNLTLTVITLPEKSNKPRYSIHPPTPRIEAILQWRH